MFYKLDSTKITLKEFSFEGKFSVTLSGILGKIFRFRLSSSTDDPPVESVFPFEIEEDFLPPEVAAQFEPIRTELEGLGFHSPIFHSIKDSLTATQYYWATFRHPSGEAFARISYRHWAMPTPPRTYIFPVFVSGFTDGTWLISTAGKADMLAPPQVRELRMVKANASSLWQAHSAELGKEKAVKNWYGFTTTDHLRQIVENLHITLRDFHVKRGVLVPLETADLQQFEAMKAARQQAVATGSQFPEVHAQIEALQRKQASWGNAIFLLIISILCFVGAGSAQWDWRFALLIVPVLFFHELGHYVTMRMFKYRNLRMFFIPFFGAAVSGRNYNVAGWKKVIVSLAGPVPGIFLGAVLGGIGLLIHKTWMTKLAVIMLILNGINLLPILPLDGGWVMHTLLFSRHYVLDFCFRLLAVVALAAWSVFGGGRMLLYVAIATAVSLPAALKLAKITTRLRKANLPEVSVDNQTIPHLTAETIITEVRGAFPKGLNAKTTAQHTLQIFETLNARPPGWFASIFYMGVHGASIAAALAFAGIIMVGERGGFSDAMAGAMLKPHNKVSCSAMELWPRGSETLKQNETVVGTFKKKEKAEQMFHDLQPVVEGKGRLRLFGQSVMAAIPPNDDELRGRIFNLMEKSTTNVFVQSTNFICSGTLVCAASDETTAKQIENEVEPYLAIPKKYHPIAPWSSAKPSENWMEIMKSRQTFQKLQSLESKPFQDKEIENISRQISAAKRRGDKSLADKLNSQQKERRQTVRESALKEIQGDGQFDSDTIALYQKLPPPGSTNHNAEIDALLAKRLGQVKLTDGRPDPAQLRNGIAWGMLSRKGTELSLQYVTFNDVFHGPPALVEWLCQKGCTNINYAFHGSYEQGAESESEEGEEQ